MKSAQLPRKGSAARNALFVAAAMSALGAIASGCGSPSSQGASQRSTTTTTTTTTPSALHAPLHVTEGTGSIGSADPTTTIPKEGGLPIPPIFAAGQNVIIGAKGCLPATLEANVTLPVVWTNLSDRPQRVVFTGGDVDSGTIAPGETFTWSTNFALVFVYRVFPSGSVCKLQMNQPNI